uniref:Orf216 protein n=1 Tax=Beta vulgaris subsp. vulgaris TaxID=3555 RepID=Q5U6K0_BETVV|nr:orf216 [Beta vulgaris subsp. vulgaris]
MPGPCSDFRHSSILLLTQFPTWSENPLIPKQRQKLNPNQRFDLLPLLISQLESRLQLVSHSNMNNQQGHLLSLPLLALLALLGTHQQTLSPQSPGAIIPSLAHDSLPSFQRTLPVIDSQKGLSYSQDFWILVNASLPSSTSDILLESLISDKRLNVLVHILYGISSLLELFSHDVVGNVVSSVRFDSKSFTSDLPSIVGKAEAEHTSIIMKIPDLE